MREVFLKAGVGRDDDDDEDEEATQAKKKLMDGDKDNENTEKDPDVAKLEEDELNLLLRPTLGGITGPRPTAASLGIKETIEHCLGEKASMNQSTIVSLSKRLLNYLILLPRLYFANCSQECFSLSIVLRTKELGILGISKI